MHHSCQGAVKCRHLPAHLLKRLNPLSAITFLYLGNISKKTDFRVTSLSLILPLHAFDTNVIAEIGATQTKNLSVCGTYILMHSVVLNFLKFL